MTNVKIYSTPTCQWCKRTKEFLKANSINYQDIDVSESHQAAEEMIEKSGQMSVPVIDVDGEIVLGFDKRKLAKLLNIAA